MHSFHSSAQWSVSACLTAATSRASISMCHKLDASINHSGMVRSCGGAYFEPSLLVVLNLKAELHVIMLFCANLCVLACLLLLALQ